MDREWPLGDLDSAQYQLKCAVDTLSAVHTAMEHGPSSAEDYKDALWGAIEHLYIISKEITDCVQACFDEKKREKAGVA